MKTSGVSLGRQRIWGVVGRNGDRPAVGAGRAGRAAAASNGSPGARRRGDGPARIGHGCPATRTKRTWRDGAARTRTTSTGRPNWKNGPAVDQKTLRTTIGTTIGGPNWKNRRTVDQKTLRTTIGTTNGGPNWKNGRAVDQKTLRTTIGTTIGGANWKDGRAVDQKGPRWRSERHGAGSWRPCSSAFGVRTERGGPVGAHSSLPMGAENAKPGGLAPTFPLRRGRKMGKRAAWRPLFPSDVRPCGNRPLGAARAAWEG